MINRKVIRLEIATSLLSYVDGLAFSVYHYKPDSWDEAPFVAVLDSGSFRTRMTQTGTRDTLFFEIHSIVPYSDEVDEWTPENAEDALGDLEYAIAQFIYDSSQHTWKHMEHYDRSRIDRFLMDGREFLDEIIPIKVEVF